MGKGKARKKTEYCERGFEWGCQIMLRPPLYICKYCNFTVHRHVKNCSNCHSKDSMESFGYRARPPRKGASKRKWKEFREKFDNNRSRNHICR